MRNNSGPTQRCVNEHRRWTRRPPGIRLNLNYSDHISCHSTDSTSPPPPVSASSPPIGAPHQSFDFSIGARSRICDPRKTSWPCAPPESTPSCLASRTGLASRKQLIAMPPRSLDGRLTPILSPDEDIIVDKRADNRFYGGEFMHRFLCRDKTRRVKKRTELLRRRVSPPPPPPTGSSDVRSNQHPWSVGGIMGRWRRKKNFGARMGFEMTRGRSEEETA